MMTEKSIRQDGLFYGGAEGNRLNLGVAPSSRREQQSTGPLHLNRSNPVSHKNKPPYMGACSTHQDHIF